MPQKPFTFEPFTLIGEEIAGAWNAQALSDAAHAWGGTYVACDAADFSSANAANGAIEPCPHPIQEERANATAAPFSAFDWLLAAENTPNAQSIYDCRPPVLSTKAAPIEADTDTTGRRALIVGNEARGVRRQTLKRAHCVAEIPLVSQNINCLNVAAAAAVMLYYLAVNEARMAQGDAPLGQKRQTLGAIQKFRPDILLIGGRDPMELGSVIRSACAFGWERVFLEDRYNAWYAPTRLMKAEGRGAARRGRNPIKVIPCPSNLLAAYDKIIVVTRTQTGRPLYAVPLVARPAHNTLVVLTDEQGAKEAWNAPRELQAKVTYASLPPVADELYHYRQAASIGLAEAARQMGRPDGNGIYLRSRKQRYQKRSCRCLRATV